ncbi:hypothetical protein HYX02_04280 [Candidatus Woesearchaeota archaeon]|nr:hypothetical protein [Candidatus Woesearchaeota archaeon]
MKKPRTNFLEWNNKVLIFSLKKINLNIILIVFLDFLFYLSSGLIITFWLKRVQGQINAFNLPTDIAAVGAERAQQLLGEMKNFYYLLVFSFLLIVVIVIFLASIFKAIIWAKTTGAKVTLELVSRFLGLNLIWMGFWLVAVILVLLFVEPSSAPVFLTSIFVLSTYLTNTLYTLFMKKQRIKVVIDSIKLSFAKIHLFLLPYALIYSVFYIITKINSLLKFKYALIFANLLLLVYVAVVRYYASTLVLEIEAQK